MLTKRPELASTLRRRLGCRRQSRWLERDLELFFAASLGLLNAALGLPQLLPTPREQIPAIRLELEVKAYNDIGQMDG